MRTLVPIAAGCTVAACTLLLHHLLSPKKMANHVTSRDYRHPYHPLVIQIFNKSITALEQLLGFQLITLDAEYLLEEAKRKSGLSDYGDMWWREAFERVIDSKNKEAHLTPLGRMIASTIMLMALTANLRVVDLLKKHPEINDIDLGKQIVIAALHRTGTTMLQRLIAADPNMRALLSWEIQCAPHAEEGRFGTFKRRQEMHWRCQGAMHLSPDFFATHPLETDGPEEDVILMSSCFMSNVPYVTNRTNSYSDWLETQDQTRAYEWLKTTLKVLHWQRPAANWVLKSPHHLEHLDTLLKVFPDAVVVQTHRDPQKTIGSVFSLVAHGCGMASDTIDPIDLKEFWMRKLRHVLKRSMEVRKNPEINKRIIDISYHAVMKDPIGEVKRVYDFAGIPYTADTETAWADILKIRTQTRYGRHVYSLADFGVTKQDIEDNFGHYRDHYNIPFEDELPERQPN
eukprot:gene16016-24519_t